MSLWGNNDNVTTASAGVVTASGYNGTVTGHGTTFTNYTVGQTFTMGVGATTGFGVIETITDNLTMQLLGGDLTGTVHSMDEDVVTFPTSPHNFAVGERPKYLDENPRFAPSSGNDQRGYQARVFGVNNAIQSARQASDSAYTPTHGGWVGVTTYNDSNGNLRVKTETYVAMSGISTQTQIADNVLPV